MGSFVVDGKTLYPNQTYSHQEYAQLSYRQKGELLRARNKAREEQSQSRQIQSAITDGIEAALSAQNLNAEETEQNGDGTQADSTGNKRALISATDQLKRRRSRSPP